MVAVKHDLIIEQGATWTVEITYNGTNGAPQYRISELPHVEVEENAEQ